MLGTKKTGKQLTTLKNTHSVCDPSLFVCLFVKKKAAVRREIFIAPAWEI